jgi:VanZ family protein
MNRPAPATAPATLGLLLTPAARPWWRRLLWLLVLVVCFFAFSPRAPGLDFENADKWQHIAAFAALSACAALARPPGPAGSLRAGAWMGAFGLLIEAVQWFIPNRSADGLDVIADALGIALGLALVALARRRWPASAR